MSSQIMHHIDYTNKYVFGIKFIDYILQKIIMKIN